MNSDIEIHIRQNCPWTKLPLTVKQLLGNSQKEYEKLVVHYSIKNQLRYRGNLVRHIRKDEKRYYEDLLRYSREHLMLYPYHLSDFIITGMRITPFQYYISIMQDLMEQEKSYDALPNFSAADCLRLLGIGRNQYIELMNRCRSSRQKFFGVRKKSIKELLPAKPVSDLLIEPWWIVQVGYVTEDDIKMVSETEKHLIDKVIDDGPQRTGDLDTNDVKSLYRKGLIYLDVPIEDDDCIVVPPLEGFVMNRVLGDYFETLLYKIFVSIDEHTTMGELSTVLQIDQQLVKNAVSMYCRLAFAHKKSKDIDSSQYHPSWRQSLLAKPKSTNRNEEVENFMNALNIDLEKEAFIVEGVGPSSDTGSCSDEQVPALLTSNTHSKRIGFLFDSTLTAFLMMGNLSSGLKSHAVTMFEVGKLSDESLDSFLQELEKVADFGEGEAQRYFDHALTLRNTIMCLRYNPEMIASSCNDDTSGSSPANGLGLDLIRCESLQNLDQESCSRLLNKNYVLLISMAPLTNEIRPVTSCTPPHLGPPIPEISSVWFKLFIYTLTKCGPASLLLIKGTRLRVLPSVFRDQDKLLVTTWGHDPGTVPTSSALPTLNDALCHSSILIQGQADGGEFAYVPFPFTDIECNDKVKVFSRHHMESHQAIQTLSQKIDLQHCCGYVTMMRLTSSGTYNFTFPSLCSSSVMIHHEELTSSNSFQDEEFKHSILPTNGIPDSESQEILTEELDSLDQSGSEAVPQSVTDDDKKSLQMEIKPKALKVKPSSLKHSSSDKNYDEKEWTLLDCSFGIPLFNSQLNKDVCHRAVSRGLCHMQSLKELAATSRKLCLQLLQFISEYQEILNYGDTRSCVFMPTQPGCDYELPLPTNNLLFVNGVLTVWDGT